MRATLLLVQGCRLDHKSGVAEHRVRDSMRELKLGMLVIDITTFGTSVIVVFLGSG